MIYSNSRNHVSCWFSFGSEDSLRRIDEVLENENQKVCSEDANAVYVMN